MNINLLELLQSQLGGQVVNQVSNFLGESESSTGNAIKNVLPSVLGGLMAKSTTRSGASEIFDLLGNANFSGNTNLFGTLANIFTGGNDKIQSLINLGAPLLKTVFGDKLGGIVDLVSSASGVSRNSSSSLLGMALPAIMGLLGQQKQKSGFDLSGLVGLLMGQKDYVKAAAPAGLASSLGFSNFDDIIGAAKNNFGASILSGLSGSSSSSTSHSSTTYTREEENRGGGGFGKWLPLLLLLLLGGLGFFLWKSCNKTATEIVDKTKQTTGAVVGGVENAAEAAANAAGNVATDAANAAAGAANAAAGAAADVTAKLGKFFNRKLADGVQLNVPENGIENKLVMFIEDKGKPVDKTTWFSFDRLLFDTGKATLQPQSQEQLKNIAAIMKAYPQVEIKLGGYTDNVGDPKANLKLSTDRANAVMAELVKMGVAAKRVAAEGYGDQHPVADNNTEEGRQQNRRIDVRVTKK